MNKYTLPVPSAFFCGSESSSATTCLCRFYLPCRQPSSANTFLFYVFSLIRFLRRYFSIGFRSIKDLACHWCPAELPAAASFARNVHVHLSSVRNEVAADLRGANRRPDAAPRLVLSTISAEMLEIRTEFHGNHHAGEPKMHLYLCKINTSLIHLCEQSALDWHSFICHVAFPLLF